VARNRFFIAFFGDKPKRVYWLVGFYIFCSVWGLALFIATPNR
jgi:hypothetical protein